MQPVVRKAELSDLPALARLDALCFDDPWSDASLRAEVDGSHCRPWLCEVGGVAVGSLLAWQLFDELQINRVAVDPTVRGRGYGRVLVRHALASAQADGAVQALLEVRADNAAAIGLYLTEGFVNAGRRKQYYHDGMDALVLTLALPPTTSGA